ncbi:MAG: C39 family peptidase [Bryobacteraceae bacterium]|nr:C39 family peptidase [Bryobacteraceae bacterium]
MALPVNRLQRVAGFELNALRASEVFGEELEKVSIPARGTPIHDLNGTVLFHRLPLTRGRVQAGYADVAIEELFGEPLLATAMDAPWDEKALLEAGTVAANKVRRGIKYNATRFVAYSYPKIALQFLQDGVEALMLELHTWAVVPPAQKADRKPFEPSNFERWSLLEETPAATRLARASAYNKRLRLWEAPALTTINPRLIQRDLLRIADFVIKLIDTREIHYSERDTDHVPCYELRGQQTNVWCVGASVEMILNFYRYNYTQVRLATELGLGTLQNPNGLPYARVGDVVTVIERLTNLDCTMHTNPSWTTFRSEIRANRPLISFVPGHSRTVVGYTRSMIALPGNVAFRGLLVYDPWPPNAGVITRWENFNTQTYQYAYSSVITQV